MSLPAEALDPILSRVPAPVARTARKLIGVLAEVAPDLDPAVKSGWGSVNYRHPQAGFLCAVFPGQEHVALVFEDGRLLSSPLLTDNGKVKRVRWIELRAGDDIPVDEIAILLAEAIALRA
jgi:hypothetical protein